MIRGRWLAMLAVTLAIAIAACGSDSSEPASLRDGALSAEAFADSIGVGVHFNYTDTTYGRQPEILQRLRELGVRHIRDAMPIDAVPLATGLQEAQRAGIRVTLTTGDVALDPASAVRQSLEIVDPEGVDAFEGPNELDNSGDPNWPATLERYMPKLVAAVRRQAPDVPVLGPSFVYQDSRDRLADDLPGIFNGHPYPGGEPPEAALRAELDRLPDKALDRGVVFTETGYHNALQAGSDHPPASEEAAAVYMPRLLLAAFGAGVRRTFIYELADVQAEPAQADPVQHFGLLRSDLTPKPAFTAVQTLIRAIGASPGRPSFPVADWSLRGEGVDDVQRLTLVREDGSRVIALWRPVSVWDRDARRALGAEPLRVELDLGRSARDVVAWRPSVSSGPVLRRDAAERVPLELGGDVVLVSHR
jgi:hypothetical protein